MSSTSANFPSPTTGATASATPSAACGGLLYDIPSGGDVACAMPFGGNSTRAALMAACCGSDADVVAYRDDCGLYCLVVDQTVDELTDCLFDRGAAWGDVFCRGSGSASATAPSAAAPTTAAASVIASASSSDDRDDRDDNDGDDADDRDDAPDGESAAARGVRPDFAGAKMGLVIGTLLFSATAFGALQL